MNVAELLMSLRKEVERRFYIHRVDILEQTLNMLKARLYIAPDIFIQIYRNDRFDSTNLALIHNGARIYGRDQVGGAWHRHDHAAPDRHDTTPDGQESVTLAQFLDEAETVMASTGLP